MIELLLIAGIVACAFGLGIIFTLAVRLAALDLSHFLRRRK
jgi:hypothetical protein